ncbi:MAG: hypothetical protein E4H19_09420 [Chromatiales bacterium]|jgi:hypothetical protein|nr:MAG: hypothetical protein E4H19_09420 [Chromatiales bacterium]
MRIRFLKLAVVAALITAPGIGSAFTVYDGFGPFPNASFGGTGIPNNAVAASKQIIDGNTTITIAMNATERYSNPVVGNNSAAVFYATPGQNCGIATDPVGCPSATQGALWNWNYYIDIVSGSGKVLADYQIDIWYDLNPAGPTACCSTAGLGRIDVTAALLAFNPGSVLEQGSENLLFNYLNVGSPPYVIAPGGAFNPNALGNYQFAITVSSGSFPLDSVAMEVQVIPVPAAAWLFGSALGLFGVMRRRATA